MEIKYNIGDIVRDNKKNIEILGHEIRTKTELNNGKYREVKRLYYKYRCLNCSSIDYMYSSDINRSGCRACNGKKVIQGVNDLYTTHNEVVKYFKDKEESKRVTAYSSKNIECICPDCGALKITDPAHLVRQGFSCSVCSDNISYPEKFIMSLLNQTKIRFIRQFSKKDAEWCDKYKYDFYLVDYDYILEVHGMQHYTDNFNGNKGGIKENDKIKEVLAIGNIKEYIILDCRYSAVNYIRESILKSKLVNIINMSNIDFNQCDLFATKSMVIEAVNLWNNDKNITTGQIAKQLNVSTATVQRYLDTASKNNLCDYSIEEGNRRGKQNQIKSASVKVRAYLNGKLIGEFESIRDVVRYCNETYNIDLSEKRLSDCLNSRIESHKGVKVERLGEKVDRNYQNIKRAVYVYRYSGELEMKFESTEEAAKYFNVSITTINRWCNGEYKPRKYNYLFKH